MKKLELKHFAAYLPYGLECLDLSDETIFTLDALNIDAALNDATYLNTIRLYLRPLSDLTKEIEVNGEKFVPCNFLKTIHFYPESNEMMKREIIDSILIECQIYWINEKLLKWHFDIYGLIENDLAIDINTL